MTACLATGIVLRSNLDDNAVLAWLQAWYCHQFYYCDQFRSQYMLAWLKEYYCVKIVMIMPSLHDDCIV